ncbi:hypothetical protein GCK72_016774 [Caenorhabditis remanei]|uniref:Uncharacterized protein n=1 Tax=Caenorhabditis remanei TaxID=31234 RepID=A0A6A5G5K5_CAERE|nr:hypothetical protein GCK72_016774 [Caenorhabditis remanei]KAF1750227.1 hypothetical protein GCK72_016774 [Caenorhabditis remanei]
MGKKKQNKQKAKPMSTENPKPAPPAPVEVKPSVQVTQQANSSSEESKEVGKISLEIIKILEVQKVGLSEIFNEFTGKVQKKIDDDHKQLVEFMKNMMNASSDQMKTSEKEKEILENKLSEVERELTLVYHYMDLKKVEEEKTKSQGEVVQNLRDQESQDSKISQFKTKLDEMNSLISKKNLIIRQYQDKNNELGCDNEKLELELLGEKRENQKTRRRLEKEIENLKNQLDRLAGPSTSSSSGPTTEVSALSSDAKNKETSQFPTVSFEPMMEELIDIGFLEMVISQVRYFAI